MENVNEPLFIDNEGSEEKIVKSISKLSMGESLSPLFIMEDFPEALQSTPCNESIDNVNGGSLPFETPSDIEISENSSSITIESPRPCAFTIDFGERKEVDTSRFKSKFEKYASHSKHRRNQSMSKIESSKETKTKPPLSVHFPRKANFCSNSQMSDKEERSTSISSGSTRDLVKKFRNFNFVKQSKSSLTLPLKNTTMPKMSVKEIKESFVKNESKADADDSNRLDLIQFSPEIEIKNISSPETPFDLFTPDSLKGTNGKETPSLCKSRSSYTPDRIYLVQTPISENETQIRAPKGPLERATTERNAGSNIDVNSREALSPDPQYSSTYEVDEINSDTVSETGTYTIEGDNYTEEQKARMSIDQEFSKDNNVVEDKTRRTQHFVESTLQYIKPCNHETPLKSFVIETNVNITSTVTPADMYSVTSTSSTESSKNFEIPANSEVKDMHGSDQKIKNRILFAKNAGIKNDQGTFTSITTCGVFSKDRNMSNLPTNSNHDDVVLEKNHLNELYRSFESKPLNCEVNEPKVVLRKPPMSPTKIPSPIHTLGRPRSRISLDLSDVDTDYYLHNTQSAITNLQTKFDRTFAQNLLKDTNNTRHIRHNSFDTSQLLNNSLKLETFQNKISYTNNIDQTKNIRCEESRADSGIDTDQTSEVIDLTNYYAHGNGNGPRAKHNNTPNSSPFKRSTSFSAKVIEKQSNLQNHIMASSYTGNALALRAPYTSPTKPPYGTRSAEVTEKRTNIINANLSKIPSSPKSPKRTQSFRNESVESRPRKPTSSPTPQSPKRSISFRQNEPISLEIHSNSPNLAKKTVPVHRSSSTANIRKYLNPFKRNNLSASAASTPPQSSSRNSSSNESINKKEYGNVNRGVEYESSSEDDQGSRRGASGKTFNTRYNRAFSLRRARLDSGTTPEVKRKEIGLGTPPTSSRSSSIEPRKANTAQSRYLNIGKNSSAANGRKPVTVVDKTVKRINSPQLPNASISSGTSNNKSSKKTSSGGTTKPTSKKGNRSNSSLTSKEVEFQNWKRRKSYDPMKAAAEGRKKAELNRKINQNLIMTQSYTETHQEYDSSPSHSASSVHRSQSFHGTASGLENAEVYIQSSEDDDDDLTLSDHGQGITPPAPTPNASSPAKASKAWYQRFHKF